MSTRMEDIKQTDQLPLAGIRVLEMSHMVMGPTCGMILGDLGAEVIKGRASRGDGTRRLLGAGAGFFRTFNRNKKSVALDLENEEGREALRKLADTADIFIENFKPGRMKSLGLDYDALKLRNPRLVYVSHKGFLAGPYENRLALDEVVQMMAVLRGDNEPIRIGERSNVQEGAVLHADPGFPLLIEAGVSIGHQAMLHGCTVRQGALIGIQAVILNGAVIGRNCLVGAGAVVTEGRQFPDNSLILGAPAKVVRELTEDAIAGMRANAADYVERRDLFRNELVRIA